MKLSDFDFTLPSELIAQNPAKKRDESNLLVAAPNNHLVQTKFHDIIDYILTLFSIIYIIELSG
jgi:S-adenosylmethionine:tRNA ribosyltransferase-isomerase